MPRRARSAAWVVMLAWLATGCGVEADVTRDELVSVIDRDAVTFAPDALPEVMVDRLAAHRVVLIGETHHLREHWAFIAELVAELHARGFRQLLLEMPQMADWLFDDYVTGGALMPDFEPPPFWLRRLEAIRTFNDTLPVDERMHVRAIDANEEWYGGANAFRDLLGALAPHLSPAGPVATFLDAAYGTPDAQAVAIETLDAALATERRDLVAAWGEARYGHVVEMVEVERDSIDIRVERREDDNQAARMREDVIKRLVDARIAGDGHGVVINIGGHHAQKAHLKGTKQEWLGDYLAHRSAVAGGDVIVVGVTSARTELEPGAGGTPFDVRETSPEHELFRVMAERLPGEHVFLALDDPLFRERRVAVNSEDTIYITALHEQYDAVLQYGLAHRMPVE